MSIEEFNNFSNLGHEALSDPKPKWDHFAAAGFVFQAITTIGKKAHKHVQASTVLTRLGLVPRLPR